jgi:hypothetical protein
MISDDDPRWEPFQRGLLSREQAAELSTYASEWLRETGAREDRCPIVFCVEVGSLCSAIPELQIPGVEVRVGRVLPEEGS